MKPNTPLAILVTLLVTAATVPVGSAQIDDGPERPACVHPDQAEDARANVQHLREDAEANDPTSVLGDLQPERSPHVKQATWPGDLVVTGTLLLVNIDLTVCGDVIVLPGAELTLYGATLAVEHPDRDTGSLWALGQSVPTDRTLDAGRLASFNLSAVHEDPRIGGSVTQLAFTHPDRSSVVRGLEDPLHVRAQGHLYLETDHTLFSNLHRIDVESLSRVDVRNTTIETTDRGLYLYNTPDAQLHDTSIRAEGTALYVTSDTQGLRMANLTLVGQDGLQLRHTSHVRMSDLTVQAQDRALYGFDADQVRLAESTLSANRGVYLTSTVNAVLEANTIATTGTAVAAVSSPNAEIAGNTLTGTGGGGHGVFVDRSARALVTGNDVQGFGNGIENRQADATSITCNRVDDNARGVYVTTSSQVQIHDNHLHGNDNHDLHGFLSGKLDARENWWGQSTGPVEGQIHEGTSTTIVTDPWAQAPIDCVPR
jgi:hypothetical protein